ncbi:MAG TPA: fumarylacetoacetate hydrolase family protein [Nevskia sp.]|nr:fumarylacetoacetate hydrolase family protein [Nevskia sp.]
MTVNRIFCIGRNYAAHIEELGNTPDEAFVLFMKPASCVVPPGQAVRLPRNRGSVHHEAELVVLLTGGGGDIPEDQALSHISHLTLGLDLTLRDLQNELKNKGNPWELAKAFDQAAPLGEWKPYQDQDLQALEFTCHVNGSLRQHGKTRDMLFNVARQIHILSRTWALQDGDIVYTGTPAGVGPLLPGDRIALESAAIGRFEWNCV